jgi:hypothetical protein
MKKRDVCTKFDTYVFISVMADMKPFRTVHTMYHMMHTMYHMMHSMYHRLTVYRRGGVRRSPQVEEEEYTITIISKLAQLCFRKRNGQHSYKQTLCIMKTQRLLWKENTDSNKKVPESNIIKLFEILINNILLSLEDLFFKRQLAFLCVLTNLLHFSYEAEFL